MAHIDGIEVDAVLSRRGFLGAAGVLVVSWALPLPAAAAASCARRRRFR